MGESGVGKTAILNKYVNGKFIEEHKATIGADFMTKDILNDEKNNITLQMWDTAGQERFQSLGFSFYRGADACILVYDITNEQSFMKIEEWRSTFISQIGIDNPHLFPFLLLGNKMDKESQRKVKKEDALMYAKKNNMLYHETSAVDGRNIDDAFYGIAIKASIQDEAPVMAPKHLQSSDVVNIEEAYDDDQNNKNNNNNSNNGMKGSQCFC